jgi:hypothetical protein
MEIRVRTDADVPDTRQLRDVIDVIHDMLDRGAFSRRRRSKRAHCRGVISELLIRWGT